MFVIIPFWIVTLNEYASDCPAYAQYTTHRTVSALGKCMGSLDKTITFRPLAREEL